jgi:hypothetical protein
LVFIGTPNQPWHGFDKIEQMIKHFKDYQFNIIGTDGKNSENVTYFGYLGEKEAAEVIRKCDIGIGTLALYRKKMDEASPLKTRQYLACGLSLIYAYRDTDLPESVPFALKLSNNEKNIDIKKIETFIVEVWHKTSIREEARRFAETVLNYDKKEKKRLLFFKRILGET